MKLNLILFIIIYSFTNASSINAEEKVFSLAFDDFKPFHWVDKTDMKLKGIFIDICEEVIHKKLGYKIEYYEYPWERAQLMVKTGVHDAFITTPTPERLLYTEPNEEAFIFMTKKIFTGSNNPRLEELKKVKEIKDLENFRLLNYIGDGWGKEKIHKEAGLKPKMVSSISSILKMLAINRGDAVISSPAIIHFELKMLGLTNKVIELPITFDKVPFKLCVRKESEFVKELPAIDKIIAEMRADGTLNEILNKWR